MLDREWNAANNNGRNNIEDHNETSIPNQKDSIVICSSKKQVDLKWNAKICWITWPEVVKILEVLLFSDRLLEEVCFYLIIVIATNLQKFKQYENLWTNINQ